MVELRQALSDPQLYNWTPPSNSIIYHYQGYLENKSLKIRYDKGSFLQIDPLLIMNA